MSMGNPYLDLIAQLQGGMGGYMMNQAFAPPQMNQNQMLAAQQGMGGRNFYSPFNSPYGGFRGDAGSGYAQMGPQTPQSMLPFMQAMGQGMQPQGFGMGQQGQMLADTGAGGNRLAGTGQFPLNPQSWQPQYGGGMQGRMLSDLGGGGNRLTNNLLPGSYQPGGLSAAVRAMQQGSPMAGDMLRQNAGLPSQVGQWSSQSQAPAPQPFSPVRNEGYTQAPGLQPPPTPMGNSFTAQNATRGMSGGPNNLAIQRQQQRNNRGGFNNPFGSLPLGSSNLATVGAGSGPISASVRPPDPTKNTGVVGPGRPVFTTNV
jgi:hypothetical protein